jgi:[acyl-carrier-protein] S-malonyltransferase
VQQSLPAYDDADDISMLASMKSTTAWLFPGQGSQVPSMGKTIAESSAVAASTYDEASDAIGFDIRALCWDATTLELDRTPNAQPAILATSIAALRAAQAEGLIADNAILLGHSLGEFTALVAGGALDFGDALRLVRKRGELMQAADASGGMAAVLGLDADAVAKAIDGTGIVVANDNAPGQVVVTGPLAAMPNATEALKAAGAKRVILLKVSGAFHSPAMKAVAPALAEAIRATHFDPLKYRVIANVDAQVHTNSSDFVTLLEKQVHSPVQWVASVRRAAGEGATTFIEFGAGNVLTGLVKRILPDARTANVSDPASLKEALELVRQDPHREPR